MGMYMALSLSVCKFHFEKKKGSNLGIPYFQKKKKKQITAIGVYIFFLKFISIYIYINKTLIIPSRERNNENNFK
jgi:hypothetical protein